MLLKPASPRSKSTLQRARARLEEIGPVPDEVVEPEDPQLVALLDRYMAAFNNADPAGLENIPPREEATIEAPPFPTWFQGRRTCVRYLANLVSGGDYRMLATRANGQLAAAACQLRNPQCNDAALRTSGVRKLLLADDRQCRSVFRDPAPGSPLRPPRCPPGS